MAARKFHGKEGVDGSSPSEGFVVFASILGNFGVCAARSDPNVQRLWATYGQPEALINRMGNLPRTQPVACAVSL